MREREKNYAIHLGAEYWHLPVKADHKGVRCNFPAARVWHVLADGGVARPAPARRRASLRFRRRDQEPFCGAKKHRRVPSGRWHRQYLSSALGNA